MASIPKACSGKCKGGACSGAPRVWVIAACEGKISLFRKSADGALTPVLHQDHAVLPSIASFLSALEEAERTHQVEQLVIVGSATDIAWIHTSLPASLAHHVAAEITYPLVPGWFREVTPNMPALTQALGQIFRG